MKNLQDSLKPEVMSRRSRKDLRIRQIQEALRYANQAQVTKPQIQQTQDVTQDTMFLLGSEALESMIKHEATVRWCSRQTTIRHVKTCWISKA